MRVMTFSRYFPQEHPKAGHPTWFVEKIMASLADSQPDWKMLDDFVLYDWHQYYNAIPKGHTIRAGHRWKVGDFFSPRIWSGTPYRSKQVIFSEPLMVAKTWRFQIINGGLHIDSRLLTSYDLGILSKNDGLSSEDFLSWFMPVKKKQQTDFEGQIICWNPTIEYNFLTPNK